MGGGDLGCPLDDEGGIGNVGREVLQIASPVGSGRGHASDLGDGVVRRLRRSGSAIRARSLESVADSSASLPALETLEAVGAEDRARGQPGGGAGRRSRARGRPRRSSVARKRLAWRVASAAATRARSAVKSSRSPRPTTSTRSGLLRAQDREGLEARLDVRRSPAPRRSRPGRSSPAKRPMQSRSASVSAGAESECSRRMTAHDSHRPSCGLGVPARTICRLPSPRRTRRPNSMPKSVILVHRPHALREDGWRARLDEGHRARWQGDRGCARALRGRRRAGRLSRLRTGSAGRPGADPLASGPDRGRHPQGGSLRDDQQGLCLRDALGRASGSGDSRRRSERRRRRRDGVDVECSVSASGRAVRLPDGRCHRGRRDDARRPHQPVHRQADDQRGQRGRQRARDHPSGHGPFRDPLPRARSTRDRRGQARRRDRQRHRQVPQVGDRRRGR